MVVPSRATLPTPRPPMIEIDIQRNEGEPTRHEQLALRFVDDVIDLFRRELKEVYGDRSEPIIAHAKDQIWLLLCSLIWKLDGQVPDKP